MTGLSLTTAAPSGFEALLASVPLSGGPSSSTAAVTVPLADGFADLLSLLGVEPVAVEFEEIDFEETVEQVDEAGTATVSVSPDQIAAAVIRSMLRPIAPPLLEVETQIASVLTASTASMELLPASGEEEEDECTDLPELELNAAAIPPVTNPDLASSPVIPPTTVFDVPRQARQFETPEQAPATRHALPDATPKHTSTEPVIRMVNLPKPLRTEATTPPLAFELRLEPVEESAPPELGATPEPQDRTPSEQPELPKLELAEPPEHDRSAATSLTKRLPRSEVRVAPETSPDTAPIEPEKFKDIPELKTQPKLDQPAPRNFLADRKPTAAAPELKIPTPTVSGAPQLVIRPARPWCAASGPGDTGTCADLLAAAAP